MENFLENGSPFPKVLSEIKSLVGKKLQYVLERDIDKSGRGFFFSKIGSIISSHGKNIQMGNGDWIFWREIREYVVIEDSDVSLSKNEKRTGHSEDCTWATLLPNEYTESGIPCYYGCSCGYDKWLLENED